MAVVVVGGYDLQMLRPWAQTISCDMSRDPAVTAVMLARVAETDFRLQIRLGDELVASWIAPEQREQSRQAFIAQAKHVREDIAQLRALDWLSPAERRLLDDFEAAATVHALGYSALAAAPGGASSSSPAIGPWKAQSERLAAAAASALVKQLSQRLHSRRIASHEPVPAV